MNVTEFAKYKKCSRFTIYEAEKRGEIEIDRTSGSALVFLSAKNNKWKPGQNIGRPRKIKSR